MSPTRREFVRSLGVAVASLLVVRCVPPSRVRDEPWAGVRDAWIGLDRLARDAQDADKGERTRDRLVADHRSTLDRLVAGGDVDGDVADDLQAAFEGASTHVWRANAPITCYEPSFYPEYGVQSSSDLVQQAALLDEMAGRSGIDQAIVDQVRGAIERDMAFLALSDDAEAALVEAVVEAAAGSMAYPSLQELDLDVPPSALEAARILVEVLLGRQ